MVVESFLSYFLLLAEKEDQSKECEERSREETVEKAGKLPIQLRCTYLQHLNGLSTIKQTFWEEMNAQQIIISLLKYKKVSRPVFRFWEERKKERIKWRRENGDKKIGWKNSTQENFMKLPQQTFCVSLFLCGQCVVGSRMRILHG